MLPVSSPSLSCFLPRSFSSLSETCFVMPPQPLMKGTFNILERRVVVYQPQTQNVLQDFLDRCEGVLQNLLGIPSTHARYACKRGKGFFTGKGKKKKKKAKKFKAIAQYCQSKDGEIDAINGSEKFCLPALHPAIFRQLSPAQDLSYYEMRMPYGIPKNLSLKAREGYVLSYDTRTKNACWVYETLTKEDVAGRARRKGVRFSEDVSIDDVHRASLDDFSGSGYDRGHLVAAGNRKESQRQMKETFLLSNISPQVGEDFNRGVWRKVEEAVRNLIFNRPDMEKLHVITGPLFLPNLEMSDGKKYVRYEVIGEGNVAVPTHFFKVILAQIKNQNFEEYAIIAPNEKTKNENLATYATSIEKVEKVSGLIFFEGLSQSWDAKITKRNVRVLGDGV